MTAPTSENSRLRTRSLYLQPLGMQLLSLTILGGVVPVAAVSLPIGVAMLPALVPAAFGIEPPMILVGALMVFLWFATTAIVGLASLWLIEWLLSARANQGSITIGGDGLRWRKVGLERFRAWSEIESVALGRERDVVLTLTNGSKKRFWIGGAKAFVREAEEAREGYLEEVSVPTLPDFECSDFDTFRERALTLGSKNQYRTNAISTEHLVRVAVDPRADRTQRVGSALALANASARFKAKVRVAIGETADPRLAQALTEAVEGTLTRRSAKRALGSMG
ncbi:MAG: hypothetical protein AAGF12_25480 [Myxococcota bacterium]